MIYAIATENVIAPDAGGKVGTLRSISVETGKEGWRYDQRAALMALLATGGDLVFGGDVAGLLRAFDATTGKVLWQFGLGASVTGHPVTFAVNGKQYVAISTGATPNTFGLASLTPEARAGTANGLYVFALP
jgi:alcohol dehydrogenase (cytochrome c)